MGLRKEFVINYQGRLYYFDTTIEPLRDAEGKMEGLIVASSDTTRRHEIEEKVQETTRNLALQRQISLQREQERQQIARDLHDGPIQNLLGLMFSIQAALPMAQGRALADVLLEIQEETRELIGELRALCNELRPPALVQFGLAKAIRSHAAAFRERHKELEIDLDLEEDGETLPDSTRLAFYRIFQETLNNVIRHSKATQVYIKLGWLGDEVSLEIHDNGQGFQIPVDPLSLVREGHLGLAGMRERAEAIGGNLSIISTPGKGTHIFVKAPKGGVLINN